MNRTGQDKSRGNIFHNSHKLKLTYSYKQKNCQTQKKIGYGDTCIVAIRREK